MLLLASSTSLCSLRYFLVACVLVSFVALVVLMSLLFALLCTLMAHVKKMMRPVEGSDVADSGLDVMLSFEFGLSRVTSSDLDDYAKATWFAVTLRGCLVVRLFLTLKMMRLSFSNSFSRVG